MNFDNLTICDVVRLEHKKHGPGTAYVFDRLKPGPTPAQMAEWEAAGAEVSERVYRYAPEIKQVFVFVPDSVMVWACPNEECSGVYFDNPTILEPNGGVWHCPSCGCSTAYPDADACAAMIELV